MRFLLGCLTGPALFGQSPEPLPIPRVDGIVFDGRVDEPAWDAISTLPMVQYEPNAGEAPTERTEIRLAYDDTYFYCSMRAYDSDPNGVRATSLYRDRISGSDHLELLLDTYNDNETAYVFTTTPAGIRNDLEISNDGTGGTISSNTWLNRDFNTFWDAETTVTDQGWFAEIRIPFSSLRFQDTDGRVIMGLTVQRKVARKLERLVFPAVPPKTNFAFLRPSLAQKIVLTGIKPIKTLYVTPYVLAGHEQINALNDSGTGYDQRGEFQGNLGGDVKFSITNNLTADFTINTDFAQAEADDQLVNLSRFSLFFPEKRQFFQERASIFDFRTGGLSRLFFSRRIGLTATGEQVPIYGGVRLIGRMNTWDLAVLDMQTQRQDTIPSENFGVLRLRKRVFNRNSYLGGMFTSRIDTEGNSNLAYGVDGLIRVAGDDYLTLQWAQTFDSRFVDQAAADFKSGRLALEMNRRRRRGFGYTVGAIFSGPNYNPGVGFVDRSDFKYGTTALSHTWFRESGPFIWHKLEALGNAYLDNSSNYVLSSEYGAEWSFSRRNLDGGSVLVKKVYENILTDFPLAEGVVIPPGMYDFYRISGTYSMAVDRTVRTGAVLETGTFYDGWLHTLTLTPSWYQSKYFQLNLEYSYNYGIFDNRNEILNFHIARLRVGTALNRHISTNALLQYNGAQDLLSYNVRFRWNFREGQDLWIVVNSGLNTDRMAFTPNLPRTANRSILLKYIHTFIF
ncbi:carbohydrate binding family 9 domain-containing protein [Robiginitalea biformata]|uniref:carbohydrate binding family 9 domain-containing protein n=1 Tax=Robiginitalea biformata TaxID=252307 RepID=UPI00030DD3E6|nr:carbohydrate binding family 9 domain-containing protein [Robiginitalea biformata]